MYVNFTQLWLIKSFSFPAIFFVNRVFMVKAIELRKNKDTKSETETLEWSGFLSKKQSGQI